MPKEKETQKILRSLQLEVGDSDDPYDDVNDEIDNLKDKIVELEMDLDIIVEDNKEIKSQIKKLITLFTKFQDDCDNLQKPEEKVVKPTKKKSKVF